MKRLFIIPVLFSALLASCGKEQKSVQPSLMEASKQELADAIEERDQLLALVKEIAESMEEVKNLENIISSGNQKDLATGKNYSKIIDDISGIQETLRRRQRQLSEMGNNLEESSRYNNELKGVICALRKQVDSQLESITRLKIQLSKAEADIDRLNKEVDSLNTKVQAADDDNEQIATSSRRLVDELNTCYFVVATKNELKKHNIIETAFLRQTKILKNDFDRSFFIVNDRRSLDTINLNSSKSKILTNHPEDSYEIIEKNRNQSLHITNPEKFWSLTNYLVIQID